MWIIDLLCITVVVCFVVDLSGFTDSLKALLFRIVKGRHVALYDYDLKPLDCSLCMNWWCGLAYIAWAGRADLQGIAAVALFSYSARLVTHLLAAVADRVGTMINRI